MKVSLKVSVLLNVILSGGLVFVRLNQRPEEPAPAPVTSENQPSAPATSISDTSQTSDARPVSFRWSQLVSAKDYPVYIANLRAIGCPEPTVEDIVRGDTGRAFSWERGQLGLDGAGNGPWSQAREARLVASLLSHSSEAVVSAQGAENPDMEKAEVETVIQRQDAPGETRVTGGNEVAETAVPTQGAIPSYPLFLQNVNWSALGFTTDQQSAIAQVRQQFQNEISAMNQPSGNTANQNADAAGASPHHNPNATTGLTQWQTAAQSAEDQLRVLLGAQGYAAYEQQQYYAWYQPQVLANAGDGNLTIAPRAFFLR